jgi:hypothetical protein
VKIVIYPADDYGCGHHRLIWPAQILARQGHDVTIAPLEDRRVRLRMDNGHCVGVETMPGTDVVVLQRTTHAWLVEAIKWLRGNGIAVVVDVDDDLSAIHPENPAFQMLHPDHSKQGRLDEKGRPYLHSWVNMQEACNQATLVTVSTPGLLHRYARHGRGRVLFNYLAEHYYNVEHVDSTLIGWPAAVHSHPNDPQVAGPGLGRILNELPETRFTALGETAGVMRAFGLRGDDPPDQIIDLLDWPAALGQLGIGIAPLADTVFNSRKSWLKGLEMSAVGLPWIGSPRAEYTRLHKMGCGVLAERPKDWYRELRRLVKEPNLRAELSDAGRAVAVQLRLEDHAWRFAEAWTDAYAIQHGDDTSSPGFSKSSGGSSSTSALAGNTN